MNITCPECANKVVWRFCYPKTSHVYCCKMCGHTWNDTVDEIGGQYGNFIGPWTNEEMNKVEKELANAKPDIDWFFFKGKKLFTAWQKGSPQKLIKCLKLGEIIYWVAFATQERGKDWYERIYSKLGC
jgi:hypothetical protein